LNFSIYFKNDSNNNNDKIQFPAKKFKSDFKGKVKTILYDYKEKEISYSSAEKNNIFEKDSASEYKDETELEADIDDEIKMNPAILDFSKISLDGYIIHALRKVY
jgi:hypothetical protein